jgi:probable rRNA maturation factor
MRKRADMKKSSLAYKAITKMPLIVFHDYKALSYPKKSILAAAKLIYKKEKLSVLKKTHVILCSNRKIIKLNSMFLHRNRATDVISFNYGENDLLGEIYISLQRAKTQAKEYKVTYNNEVLRLFVHGMFHLLGYDHETEKDRKKMRAKETIYVN